jgi:hypothetical protein
MDERSAKNGIDHQVLQQTQGAKAALLASEHERAPGRNACVVPTWNFTRKIVSEC